MKKIYLIFSFLITIALSANAQDHQFTPDMSRALFHKKLDDVQKQLFTKYGNAGEGLLKVDNDMEVNLQISYILKNKIDEIQRSTELDSTLSSNDKVAIIRGLEMMLVQYETDIKAGLSNWNQLPQIVSNFENALILNRSGKSLEPLASANKYGVAKLLVNNVAFLSNPYISNAKEVVLLKYLSEQPRKILPELSRNTDFRFTDSLLLIAAKKYPEDFLNYAQARGTALGAKISQLADKDKYIQLLYRLSHQASGQMYMPFLDPLAAGKLKQSDISEALKDSTKYYALLVKTQLENARRMIAGDTPIAQKSLQAMLKQKSNDLYVTVINGLHNSPDAIRFRSIQKLNVEELYYLIVLNEESIYTSSYKYVYYFMFNKLAKPVSDSLLTMVHYDKYKKFVTMASNYNTLDHFLSKMSKNHVNDLLVNFVNNLDNGSDEEDIEDAVDVANAYGGIKNDTLRSIMYNQVVKNYNQVKNTANTKAETIYKIEKLIMESNDGKEVDLSKSLGMLPLFDVSNNFLRDDKGRVIMQMFFYGDDDGKKTFRDLLVLYGDKNQWEMKSTPEWVQYTSKNTKIPFILFANRALDENEDLDEKAQRTLIDYMSKNGYEPTITVHRGHSYFLKYTIDKLPPSSKVVILGSCGAYQNLNSILHITPDAYIISSKQTGFGSINVALFKYMEEQLKSGKDINWPNMMKDVLARLGNGRKEDYQEYVFPHKNLGALFFRAYMKTLE